MAIFEYIDYLQTFLVGTHRRLPSVPSLPYVPRKPTGHIYDDIHALRGWLNKSVAMSAGGNDVRAKLDDKI
jgi:hypothetical protein